MPEPDPVIESKSRSLRLSPTNDRKVQEAHKILDRIAEEILVKGFHGISTITLKVMDGTIQQTHESTEKLHK